MGGGVGEGLLFWWRLFLKVVSEKEVLRLAVFLFEEYSLERCMCVCVLFM